MAIVMAQLGGIGVLHRNLTIEEQCAAVRAVKRFESGMVVNPITIDPRRDARRGARADERHRISGIPVVEQGGRLVGILTNRDVRFADNPLPAGRELMTRDNLATVEPRRQPGRGAAAAPPAADREAAGGRRRLPLHRPDHRQGHREGGHLSRTRPRTPAGRLRVAAATTVGDKGFERTEALIDAECDVIVIDTAHGHNRDVARAVERVKQAVQLGAGRRRQRRHRRGDAGR